jgi:hypothetical protein
MKILDSNAGEQLFEKAKALKNQPHNSWRCIYLNLDKEQRLNAGRRAKFVVPALTTLLRDNEGYIYLCEDGDIFILFQGAVRPIMAKLSSHFDDLKPWPLWDEPADHSAFTVFDLSRYWPAFFNLCQTKSLRAASVAQ